MKILLNELLNLADLTNTKIRFAKASGLADPVDLFSESSLVNLPSMTNLHDNDS